MARPRNTPNDPQRRQRILAVTMELLKETGIASVTARSVATRAEVPVGSVSYYFDSVKGLLLQASQQLLGRRTAQIADWDYQDTGGDALLEQLAELIHHQITTGRSLTVVSYELYLLGLRDPDFQQISAHTVGALRNKLLEHFPAKRASHLAATADGYQLQALFDQKPPSVASILTTLKSE
ncbi:TetR/AcrR family transcriptional regulator [Nesterenkonia lacusekhoensis]|nr:TetR family transcriptional regulator [Nesterenkonia lacusekhoensis]